LISLARWTRLAFILGFFCLYLQVLGLQACGKTLGSWDFFFLAVGFELRTLCFLGRASPLEPLHQSPFFCVGFFWDRILWTICLGCPRTSILLISTSSVARITDVNYLHLALGIFYLANHAISK
jgi:hypothetical protein